MITVSVISREELGLVDKFYGKVGYRGGVSKADVTLVAKMNGELVGAVRLCEEEGGIVLRGMHVMPAFQRRGVGSMLLARCIPYLNLAAAYCLPYEHLVQFYGQAGFQVAKQGSLPPHLEERMARYVSSGQRVLAMWRPSLNRSLQRTAFGSS